MYLQLGQDFLVSGDEVVAVIDMDTGTASRRTGALLARLQQEGRVVELADDLPRTAVLCRSPLGETLYLSPLSPQTLQRRAQARTNTIIPVKGMEHE